LKFLLTIGLMVLACTPAFAQEWAKKKLESSPRHSEWVTLKHGAREVKSFIVYPEKKDKATTVLLIHEIFGLTDWVRLVADQLAAEGFVAIAPDLLSGMAQNKGGTESFGGDDAARKVVSQLPPDQVTADLTAVKNYVVKVPASNGKLAVAGFCWGGTQTFRFATNSDDTKSFHVFYGSAPTGEEDLAKIKAPVYGYYAENDARVGATLDKTTDQMKKLRKTFEPKTYAGSGHGFMRAGQAPDANDANKAARAAAWDRWTKLLRAL
jgi:carboxymethylenebutenolidase